MKHAVPTAAQMRALCKALNLPGKPAVTWVRGTNRLEGDFTAADLVLCLGALGFDHDGTEGNERTWRRGHAYLVARSGSVVYHSTGIEGLTCWESLVPPLKFEPTTGAEKELGQAVYEISIKQLRGLYLRTRKPMDTDRSFRIELPTNDGHPSATRICVFTAHPTIKRRTFVQVA